MSNMGIPSDRAVREMAKAEKATPETHTLALTAGTHLPPAEIAGFTVDAKPTEREDGHAELRAKFAPKPVAKKSTARKRTTRKSSTTKKK